MDLVTAESSSTMASEEDQSRVRLQREIECLREHMGLGRRPEDPTPKEQPRLAAGFFVELAPNSSRGSRCKLPTCNKGPIPPGRYRIALNPSMDYGNFRRGTAESADFYHIECFEEIADFSESVFLARVNPVTRKTYMLRGIKGSSVLDGNYLVDAGAERLLLQWIVERRRQINQRDGNPDTTEVLDKDFQDLLDLAGTPGFQAKKPAGMELHEFIYLRHRLAPNESDGDDGIWNLFEEFLFTRLPGSLEDRHDLSTMMTHWWSFKNIASKDESDLDDREKEMRAAMSPKEIRAIQRLSVIPMPDVQSAFMGGLGARGFRF